MLTTRFVYRSTTLMAQKALVHHAEANLEDCERCANIVLEHLRRRGIASVQTIHPQDESEDFSDIGAPVVVADVIRNPGSFPTSPARDRNPNGGK